MPIDAPREQLLSELREAVEYQRHKGAEILAFRFGFLRLRFVEDRYTPGYNLHGWLQDLPSVKFPHSHIFDMDARLLLQHLTNKEWVPEADDDGDCRLMIPVYQGDATRDQIEDQKYRMKLLHETPVPFDGTYSMTREVHHTTDLPPDTPVVTLLRKTKIYPEAKESTMVPLDHQQGHQHNLKQLDQEEAWRRFDEVLSHVPGY